VRVEHAFSRYREETAPGTRRPDAGLTVTQPGPQ
jgi:hypothetical protein